MRRPIIAVAVAVLILAATTAAGLGISACGGSTRNGHDAGRRDRRSRRRTGPGHERRVHHRARSAGQGRDHHERPGEHRARCAHVLDARRPGWSGAGRRLDSAQRFDAEPRGDASGWVERCDAGSEPDVLVGARQARERRDHHLGPGDGDQQGAQLGDAGRPRAAGREHDASP